MNNFELSGEKNWNIGFEKRTVGAHLRGALATEDLATCPAVVLPRESGKGDPAPGTSKYFYHNS